MAGCHIIIIGGGIGGLCCGLHLLHAGYQVSLYEKRPQVGGVIQSIPSAPGYADYDSFAPLVSILMLIVKFSLILNYTGKIISLKFT